MLLCVFDLASFDVCTVLLSVLDVIVSFCTYVDYCLRICCQYVSRKRRGCFGRLHGVIVFGMSISTYDVVSSCRCLEMTYVTIEKILVIYVGIPEHFSCRLSPLLLFCSLFLFLTFSGCVVMATRFILTVFSIPSYRTRTTSGPTLIIRYGSNQRVRSFE